MYRFLLTRQWVILTLIGLALIPAMIELGFWQLHRHEGRVARNELIAASLEAPAVPVAELTGTEHGPARGDRYRSVTASGTYDTEHEVVVRHRTAADDKSVGYFVLTPLIQRNGTAVLVNRGWIDAGGDLTELPEIPAAPDGRVTVTGRIMPDETTENSGIKDTEGLPDRQVMLINSEQQSRALDRPVLGGYLQLSSSEPEPAGAHPQRLPEPDHSSVGTHLAYAIQWWLFTAAVPAGWVILVRRELRDRAAAAAGGTEEGNAEAGSTEAGGAGKAPAATPEQHRETAGQ